MSLAQLDENSTILCSWRRQESTWKIVEIHFVTLYCPICHRTAFSVILITRSSVVGVKQRSGRWRLMSIMGLSWSSLDGRTTWRGRRLKDWNRTTDQIHHTEKLKLTMDWGGNGNVVLPHAVVQEVVKARETTWLKTLWSFPQSLLVLQCVTGRVDWKIGGPKSQVERCKRSLKHYLIWHTSYPLSLSLKELITMTDSLSGHCNRGTSRWCTQKREHKDETSMNSTDDRSGQHLPDRTDKAKG